MTVTRSGVSQVLALEDVGASVEDIMGYAEHVVNLCQH